MRTAALLLSLLSVTAFGCAASPDDAAQSSESAIEVYAQDLWAGSVSYAIERGAQDPCNNGAAKLDNNPIGYDTWARQRASDRNVCFEVWKPGVTDRENPDFWRLLDVQVHYHYKGTTEWKTAYVPSNGRRGNNRRYAWSLSYDLDPLNAYNVADVKLPFEITSEEATSVGVKTELEFYFTVNGNYLSTSTNQNFKVNYFGRLEKPVIGTGTGVLYPDVTCSGLTVGSGAGFFSADVTDQGAIDQLLADDPIHAARLSLNGAGASRTLMVHFGSMQNAPAGQLPRYYEGYDPAWRSEVRDAGNGKLALTIRAYDRAEKKVKERSVTFDQCVKH